MIYFLSEVKKMKSGGGGKIVFLLGIAAAFINTIVLPLILGTKVPDQMTQYTIVSIIFLMVMGIGFMVWDIADKVKAQ